MLRDAAALRRTGLRAEHLKDAIGDVGITATNSVADRRLWVGSDRPGVCWRCRTAVIAKSVELLANPPNGATKTPVSLRPSRRSFRDALDQVQRRQHEHLFRFGFDVQEAVLLELAKDVSEQRLLGVVANGV